MSGRLLLAFAAIGLVGCASAQPGDTQETGNRGMNTLTSTERAAGWRLLFDGRTLEGWRGYNRPDMPDGWAVEDGTLTLTSGGADIITDRQFTDFDLSLDWKVAPGGNSGIFFRAVEGQEWMYYGAPEMQIVDDERHPDGQSPLTSAGSNYGLHGVPRGIVHPAGEWNTARIRVQGDHVEQWLNGMRVVDYRLHSPEWRELVQNSKFNAWPAYGQAERGHIGLQEHGSRVWFRNIKLRELGS